GEGDVAAVGRVAEGERSGGGGEDLAQLEAAQAQAGPGLVAQEDVLVVQRGADHHPAGRAGGAADVGREGSGVDVDVGAGAGDGGGGAAEEGGGGGGVGVEVAAAQGDGIAAGVVRHHRRPAGERQHPTAGGDVVDEGGVVAAVGVRADEAEGVVARRHREAVR